MKNECSFKKKINAFLDGETASTETSLIKEHLKTCPICQGEVRELNRISHYLNEYQDEVVPEIITRRILDKIKTSEKSLLVRPVRWALAVGVAAAFLIGAYIGNLMFSTSDQYSLDFGEETLNSYFEGVK